MTTQPNPFGPRLQAELNHHTDLEDRLRVLRIFTREQQTAIREDDLLGKISLEALFQKLSQLADSVVQGSEWVAREEILRSGTRLQGDFAIVAMGKFGGWELTYYSDLDIMFLYEKSDDQEAAARLATRTISALSLYTLDGFAYRIDATLRPSGNSGALVCSLEAFRNYHREIGRTWERQALIKARPVGETTGFRKMLQKTFQEISYHDGEGPSLAAEIDHLRGRMEREIARERPGRYDLKTGRGGIVDIEFSVQYLQLLHGKKHPNLRRTNTISALESLAQEKILSPRLAGPLKNAYLFLRGLETRLRLVLDQSTDELWENTGVGRQILEQFYGGRPIFKELQDVREEVRGIYERIFHGGRYD